MDFFWFYKLLNSAIWKRFEVFLCSRLYNVLWYFNYVILIICYFRQPHHIWMIACFHNFLFWVFFTVFGFSRLVLRVCHVCWLCMVCSCFLVWWVVLTTNDFCAINKLFKKFSCVGYCSSPWLWLGYIASVHTCGKNSKHSCRKWLQIWMIPQLTWVVKRRLSKMLWFYILMTKIIY